MTKFFLPIFATLFFGFVAHASLEQYAGSYAGNFSGYSGTLTIEAHGGTLAASYRNQNGSADLYGGACNSSIGTMTKLKMDGAEVKYANFAFNPGSCAQEIEGREVTVEFGHKHDVVTKASLSIFERTESSWQQVCYPDPQGYMHCSQEPTQSPLYDVGTFKKQ